MELSPDLNYSRLEQKTALKSWRLQELMTQPISALTFNSAFMSFLLQIRNFSAWKNTFHLLHFSSAKRKEHCHI